MARPSPLNLLFVINPISGGIQKNDYLTGIKEYFKALPHKIDFFLLKRKNDAEELQKVIEQLKPHIVIAVGGDGTISLVAKKLLGTKMLLGILPAGSANGMARELGIPFEIQEALNIIKKGKARKIDIIRINRITCIHLSDIGLNAQLIKLFEKGNLRGKLGYAKVAFKVFFRKQNISVTIHAKNQIIKRNAFMVVLANASKYGTGAVINPKGDLYDGLFEVVIIRKLSLVTLFKLWFWPKAIDPNKIEVIQARSVHIETPKKAHFQVDGEYFGKVHTVDAHIVPGQLNILLPE